MARSIMQRKVKSSTVTYATIVVENGKVVQSEPKTIEVMGQISDTKAHREVKKVEAEQFIIISVEVQEALYTMPVSQFMELAKKENTNQEDVK